jgi:hypothetical protein
VGDLSTCAHDLLGHRDRKKGILSGDVGLSYGVVIGRVMGLEGGQSSVGGRHLGELVPKTHSHRNYPQKVTPTQNSHCSVEFAKA